MERPISVLRQRMTSFNPEAATFSPGLGALTFYEPTSDSSTIAETRHSTVSIAPMFNHSPFHAAGNMHSFYRRDPLAPAPVSLEDFFTGDAQALVKKLEGHPGVKEIRAPRTPKQTLTQDAPVVPETRNNLPPFTFPAQQPQPDYTLVNIDELSAELGLPTAKADSKDVVTPTASQKSHVSQAHPGALYGKLIGWALDKPLTAKGLADFLQHQDSRGPSSPPSSQSALPAESAAQQDVEPRRSQPEIESIQEAEPLTDYRTTAPVATTIIATPKGSSGFDHRSRRSSGSSTSHLHHARMPSNRRWSRRTSRAKRLDQGPMPSAADIYPDDAHWTHPRPLYETHGYASHHTKVAEQPRRVIDNVFNWPPPSQAYRPEPAPTTVDINDADFDVLALMNELPEPSLGTLAVFGIPQDLCFVTTLGFSCDERALTPAQEDGSRYGMRFYGLAYGDQWELPKIGDFGGVDSFRVRPRDHEGWGGWDWASRKGWVT